MVPPPSEDQGWQFDKFHDGGAKGTLTVFIFVDHLVFFPTE